MTPARSVTPTVADADFVLSALLVAVTVNEPAVVEEKVMEVGVELVNVPPVLVQVTPALPTSLFTVAVRGSV